MSDDASLIAAQHEGRRRFLELVAEIRPELHRYCARMVGSITDGEDVVQDALARAYYALPEMETMPQLRPWLFRIAHHRALDHLKRYDVRMREPLDDAARDAADAAADPDEALAREEATHAAITRFVDLAPAQRSAVVLKDVLGHSLDEIAVLLELTPPAVKAALHRGRMRLRESKRGAREAPRAASQLVARYADLFNARDWDGVRSLLLEECRLELVSKSTRQGKTVGIYFERYAKDSDLRFVLGSAEGRDVIGVFRGAAATRPAYVILIDVDGDQVSLIRDYRYIPYMADELSFHAYDQGESP